MSNGLRFLLPAAVFMLMAGTGSRADEGDEAKERLAKAKRVYDGELKDFKKAVTDLFDKREESVRKSGDKKALDELKSQRKAFDDLGEPPASLPMALKNQLATARTTLDKVYQTTVREYIKLKLDDSADKAEKERVEFLLTSASVSGKRIYLSNLKAVELKSLHEPFENNTTKAKIDGKLVPHSLFTHPPPSSAASVSYAIPAKAAVFRTIVGVPKNSPGLKNPASPLTFEVLLNSSHVERKCEFAEK
ncbi:hypothetical protein, partial [Zavarzinella formosa]|uniref:hypothetical protein n=1 Tax=Zavarzinella formosa TaxID=360055 RepID=UPI000592B7AD